MKRLATAIAMLTIVLLNGAQAAESDLVVTHPGTGVKQSAPVDHFTGQATVELLQTPNGDQRLSMGWVTFAPGAHTAWHTHPLGQTLIVTAGTGLVQRWGGPVEEIHPGDVVRIGPSVKHWHGAAPGSSMTHLAIQEAKERQTVHWLEAVSDDQYRADGSPHTGTATGPSRAQQLMGDVVPKLAQLTDDVLFGDVWNRAGLSRRDRSLVTVSALIALNHPEQLRSHLALALQNGLTESELAEAITQLAFYAGWPNAVTATGIAREVFQDAKR